MAERGKLIETWAYLERALKSAAVAEKGKIACIDTADGALVPVSAAGTLVPIGYFSQSMTGDGTTTCRVELFRELRLHRFLNDATTAVTDAQLMQLCYAKDGQTVSGDGTSRSVAGRVWAANASTVLVEMGVSSDLVDST